MSSLFADLLKATLARLGPKIEPLIFLAEHAAKLLDVRADGTADLATIDPTIDGGRGMSKRTILSGIPGALFKIGGGDRVRIGAEGGSPTSQEVRAFEQDPSASRGIARIQDTVNAGTWQFIKNPDPMTPPGIIISYTPPGALVPSTTFQLTGSIQIIPPQGATVVTSGEITSASKEILIR